MSTSRLSTHTLILLAGDVLALSAAIAGALLIRAGGRPEPVIIQLWQFAAPFLLGLWLLGLAAFGLYDLTTAKNEPRFFERLVKALGFNFAATVLAFYLLPEFRLRPLLTLAILALTTGLALISWRALFNAAIARRAKARVLFLGVTPEVTELTSFLAQHPQLGFSAVGAMAFGDAHDGAGNHAIPIAVLDAGRDLAAVTREFNIDHIVVAHDVKRTKTMVKKLLGVIPLGVTIVDLHKFYEAVSGKVPISLITDTWFLENLVGARRPRYDFLKRITDLVIALLIGVVALALFPAIAFAIALSTPGDILRYRARRAREGDGIIFFRQTRVGKNGRGFDFIKFRSQVLGAEKIGAEKSDTPDPRAYPAGEFLRKTYLDELPQLLNVLRGEMSFVGPRPERPEFVAELEREIPFYRMRELVLPGITGWAQINMEDDASVADAPEKIQYDLYYIKNRSLYLDLGIMLKTVLKLLQRSGR